VLEPKVGRVVVPLVGEGIFPVSGQPGPRREVMAKAQEGGRMRTARVVVISRRTRRLVVNFMMSGDCGEGGDRWESKMG